MSSDALSGSAPRTLRPPRIAIVGGGISGLAAAHRVIELIPEAQVSLFEASNRLGGVLQTVERDGFLIEQSADNFLATPSAAVDLCRELGIERTLIPTDEARRRAFVLRDGRLVPIPEGFYLMSPRRLWPLLRSPLISLSGKLRILAEPLIPRGAAALAIPQSRLSTPGVLPDESVASFARRRLGREVFERLVQPLVAGIYTADPEKLSMAATMPQFLDYERNCSSLLLATLKRSSRLARSAGQHDANGRAADTAAGARYSLFLAPERGMQQLVTELSNRISHCSIHLRTEIKGIHPTSNGWNIITNSQSDTSLPATAGNSESLFDSLILAIPAYAAAKLLQHHNAPLAAELSAIEYAGCAVVSLGFRRDQIAHDLDGFGFVVPKNERLSIIAGSFASQKFPGRAPAGSVLIRVFLGGALQPELVEFSDADLGRIALDELANLLRITGMPLTIDIARWPRSMPQYHVGHLDRIARVEQIASLCPRLALAGNAYRGVGIPQCIASGRAAAERVVAALAAK
jgi:protoporphyrinogen/coproporphyrinogen III oxidase